MKHLTRRFFLKRAVGATSAVWAFGGQAAGATERSFMDGDQLSPHLYALKGAVNTGALIKDGKAFLFDCCDSVKPERLEKLGVRSVEMICCTQYRRPNTAGAYTFTDAGTQLVVPQGERGLFEDVDAYWINWKNRWHLYHSRPGPQVPVKSMPVARGVSEGDAIKWHGFQIRVIETPGATDGSVSYLVEDGGETFGFCGDAICGSGQFWDLYSLQKGFDVIGDYHGFLGNRRTLVSSLHKLSASGATILIPSHGASIRDVPAATALLEQRLDALWRNYTAISALNYYFPTLCADTRDDPKRMRPAETFELPAWIRRVAYTSFALISESGAALLIDCGHDSVLSTLQEWLNKGTIRAIEGCWVTHYHDDHIDSLHRLANTFGCPIIADTRLSEIVEHPQRFFLPCISPCEAPIARATQDGESWEWHEFRLTAFHFPGQTLYHGGLFVEGHGKTVFFAGDSGAPTGLDDYCAGNRVFLGKDRGSRRCLALWRKLQPDYIINEHQDRAFSFTPEQLDYMDQMLAEREHLIAELVPWEDPNFGTDEWWNRAYPYEQEACAGATVRIEIQFTNHGHSPATARIEPVLPDAWDWRNHSGREEVEVAPNSDGAAYVWLDIPEGAASGRYAIPFRITWGDRYLGQFRHAVVVIR